MKNQLKKSFSSFDVAIDLGTYKTAMYVRGEGIVLEEPSLISFRSGEMSSRSIIAVGHDARQIYGKEPISVSTVKPLHGGVVEHLEATQLMVKQFAMKAGLMKRFRKPNILISAPVAISNIEKRAVGDVAAMIGSKSIGIIEEPIAAAIGSDIDISESRACMIVDAGWGITEAAVISLGGIVHCESERVGGETIVNTIVEYFKKHHSIIIGEKSAAAIAHTLSDPECDRQSTISVRGMDVGSRLPSARDCQISELAAVILSPLSSIVRIIKRTLENTPPMLSSDLIENGMILTGGTALVQKLDKLIEEKTGVPVRVTKDPFRCVVRGGGMALDYLNQYKTA